MTEDDVNGKLDTLGKRLRAARKERGLSITKLAWELNVDPRTVARWQSDDAMPSVARLGEIARVLEKSPSYFLDEAVA